MKAVRSHVLIEFDKDDRKLIQKLVDKIGTISQTWFDISRVFINAAFTNEEGWTYKDRKDPQMSKTKLLNDIRQTRARIKEIDSLLIDLHAKVIDTK